MSISQAPASTVTHFASEQEALARHHIFSIVTTLSGARNGGTPTFDAASAVTSELPSVATVQEISRPLVAVLESRSAAVVENDAPGEVGVPVQAARLIDALNALPSLISWVAQGALPRGTSPELVVAALGQISRAVSEGRELFCEAYAAQPSPVEHTEMPAEPTLSSLQQPQHDVFAEHNVQQGPTHERTERRPWFDGLMFKEWLHTLTRQHAPSSALLTISVCAASATLLKLLYPSITIRQLLVAAAAVAVASAARALLQRHSARGTAWTGERGAPQRDLSFCTAEGSEGVAVGAIEGRNIESLSKAVFITDNSVLTASGRMLSLEALLRSRIESAEDQEARTRAEVVYEAWYPLRCVAGGNLWAARGEGEGSAIITLPVKGGAMVSLPVPRGWEVHQICFTGWSGVSFVRSGVLGGALVQVPHGVKEVRYEIRPHEQGARPVITQEMVEALRSVLPEIAPTARSREVSKLFDAQALSAHDRARAHLAAMILMRFYYTKDPLVGRAQQSAQENALKVLEEMRCGTCDGLSALLVRWQREDSLVAVTSQGLVTGGNSFFMGHAGHTICTVLSESEGILDLDPSKELPSQLPFSQYMTPAARAQVLRASDRAGAHPEREPDIRSVRAWFATPSEWERTAAQKRAAPFPDVWDFPEERFSNRTAKETFAPFHSSWKAGALAVNGTYHSGERERWLATARSGDFRSLVPLLAEIRRLHSGMPDEETRTSIESLHQLLLTEFVGVGLNTASIDQQSTFLSWLTSSFRAWQELQGRPYAPKDLHVTPQLITQVLRAPVSGHLTSYQLISLTTSALRAAVNGFHFEELRELLSQTLLLHQRIGTTSKDAADHTWELVGAHVALLAKRSEHTDIGDDKRALVRGWCSAWLALDANLHRTIWTWAHERTSSDAREPVVELLGSVEAVLFRRTPRGEVRLSPEIAKLLRDERYEFTRRMSARTLQFLEYVRDNVTDPHELASVLHKHMVKAIHEGSELFPYLVIPELMRAEAKHDPVSVLYFELASDRAYIYEMGGTEQERLINARRNLQGLLKAKLVDIEKIRKEIPSQITLSPAEALEQLFTLSTGRVGTGLYVEHARGQGGVSIVDLPSVFLEMLPPESALRYLWVSHLRSVGAVHPVDPLFAELVRSVPTLSRGGCPPAVLLAVRMAVRGELESRLLRQTAPRMELYLAAIARYLIAQTDGPLEGERLQGLIASLDQQKVLSQRAHCWRPSTSPVESPVWNARIAAMLLLDECEGLRLMVFFPRADEPHLDLINTIPQSLAQSESSKLLRQFRDSPFKELVAYEPAPIAGEGDLWRRIAAEMPLCAEAPAMFMQEITQAFARLDERAKQGALRPVMMMGHSIRGVTSGVSLYSRSGEMRHLRAYSPGEDVRIINHRASARRESLVVTERQREEKVPLALIVDIHAFYANEPACRDSFYEHIALAYRFRMPLHITFIGRGVLSQHTIRFNSSQGAQASLQDCEDILSDVALQVGRYRELLRQEQQICGSVLDYSACLTLGEPVEIPSRSTVVLVMSKEAQRKNTSIVDMLRMRGHRIV